MRICYLSSSIVPSRFANSVHVMRMCEAFASFGHETMLVCVDGDKTKNKDDIFEIYGTAKKFEIKRHSWNFFLARTRIGGLILIFSALKYKVDIVFSRDIAASFATALFNIPQVLELHAPPTSFSRVDQLLLKWLIKKRKVLALVVISKALEGYFRRDLSDLETPIIVSPDGANIITHYPLLKWGENGFFNVVYLGHLYPGRGVELLCDIAKDCPWAHFHIVGGMKKDLFRFQELTRSAENVVFHGFIPPSQTAQYLRSADVCVAPYQKKVSVLGDGDTSGWMSPMKVFEYMSAGKAIIASDLPVLKEVLQHDHNAIMVSPDKKKEWIDALEALHMDPEYKRND